MCIYEGGRCMHASGQVPSESRRELIVPWSWDDRKLAAAWYRY